MKRFKNILYFADGAVDACPALERAVNLSRTNDARLTVIDVLEHSNSPAEIESRVGADFNEILRRHRQQMLESLIAPFTEADNLIYTRVVTGTAFIEVIREVLRNGFDLVVKSAQPPGGFSERLLGSTDMHLLRKCPCPVWIEPPAAAHPYRKVLAAVDPVDAGGMSCATLVMDLASSLAVRESARLEVIHAWQLHGESMLRSGRARISTLELENILERTRQQHQAMLDKLLGRYGMKTGDPGVHLIKGEPAPSIRDLSERLRTDLIVMGTVGRTGIPGFFIGNTAEDVLQATPASILAVKPDGFVSPVTNRPQ